MSAEKLKLEARREELVAEQAALVAKGVRINLDEEERFEDIEHMIKGIDQQLSELKKPAEPTPGADAPYSGITDYLKVSPGSEAIPNTSFGRWMDSAKDRYDEIIEKHYTNRPKPNAAAFVEKIFGKDPRKLSMGEWKSSEDFYAAIHRGSGDPRLQLFAGQAEASDPYGGFSVPEYLSAALLGSAYESSVLVPLVTQVPMRSNSQLIWSWDPSTSAEGVYYGGWTPRWAEESSSLTEDTAEMFQLRLESHKLALYTKSSNELLADGINFQQQLELRAGEAIGASLDYQIINGSGVGMPLGILNDPAIVSVAKDGSQTADTLKYTNLCNMLSRLSPPLFRRPDTTWLVHPSTLPELLGLVIGANESFYPVLTENSGQLRMLALNVLVTEHCATLGDTGDVILCSPREYALGVRKSITIDRSQHVNFQTDEMTWRISGRFAGSGTWKSSYTPRVGSTMSWCVKLDERA